MSNDLKDSIFLWLNVIAIAALFWAGLHFRPWDAATKTWIGIGGGALGLINLAAFFWGLWERRASNPHNPNRS